MAQKPQLFLYAHALAKSTKCESDSTTESLISLSLFLSASLPLCVNTGTAESWRHLGLI
jgi:hypothetical protein